MPQMGHSASVRATNIQTKKDDICLNKRTFVEIFFNFELLSSQLEDILLFFQNKSS